jgi:hypothetical protein
LSDCEGHADPVIPDRVQYPKRLAHVGERVRGSDSGPESSRWQKRFPELSGAHQLLLVLRVMKKAGGLDAVLYGFRQNFPTKSKPRTVLKTHSVDVHLIDYEHFRDLTIAFKVNESKSFKEVRKPNMSNKNISNRDLLPDVSHVLVGFVAVLHKELFCGQPQLCTYNKRFQVKI